MSDMLMGYKYTLIGAAAGWAASAVAGLNILPGLGPLSPAMVQSLAGGAAGYYLGDMNAMASVSS